MADDTLVERLQTLAQGVPQHIINNGFLLGKHPVGGEWFLYSDNGKGMGRQWVASFPAGKHYFGTLAQYMAAVDPTTVLALLTRINEIETANAIAAARIAELEAVIRGAQVAFSYECPDQAMAVLVKSGVQNSDNSVVAVPPPNVAAALATQRAEIVGRLEAEAKQHDDSAAYYRGKSDNDSTKHHLTHAAILRTIVHDLAEAGRTPE